LTWNQLETDLDLHVVDPNGEEIYYSRSSSSSGAHLLRDIQTGPNAVEFISWGLTQDGIKGPYGNYKVYVVAYRTYGRPQYNVAVLESPDQDWKYFNGEISNGQRQLVYQFNITNNQSSSLNVSQSENLSGVCELIYNTTCACGYDNDCNCACRLLTIATSTVRTSTTPCPNQCWCTYPYNFFYNCTCNCSFALSETPHVFLTWDQIGTDLDLHVVDPNGEEIYYSRSLSSSGGKFLRDRSSGPLAVEFISWGLIQDGIKGPNGIYRVYVLAYRNSGQTPYNVAVLENPHQDWKYFKGEISTGQRKLVYQFKLNNNQSSSLNSGGQSANFSRVCELIYNTQCACGFDSNCNCACQSVPRSTVLAAGSTISNSFETSPATSSAGLDSTQDFPTSSAGLDY
jgi:uncharacterized protein YfaP (DUF2135 family)